MGERVPGGGNESRKANEETRAPADRFCISVTDLGIGIPDDDMESLFTRFFRVNNEETRSEPGTGIGLRIALSIVELHGGKIDVMSPLGGGTTVSFYVPGAFSATDDDVKRGQASNAPVIPWSRLDESPEGQEQKAIWSPDIAAVRPCPDAQQRIVKSVGVDFGSGPSCLPIWGVVVPVARSRLPG